MELPLQITVRNFDLPVAFEDEIHVKAGKLDEFYSRITRCRIVVEVPHKRSHEGVKYDIKIYITVPGRELVIKREPNEDLSAAIRDAFDAARRKLEDFAREQRGDVKRHEEASRARIGKLFYDRGYGFLMTDDGREIYFHEHSVINKDFHQLKVGMEVRFIEEDGAKGPQASSVTVS